MSACVPFLLGQERAQERAPGVRPGYDDHFVKSKLLEASDGSSKTAICVCNRQEFGRERTAALELSEGAAELGEG